MKKFLKPTIRKKIVLLSALLSILLIAVSVTVSSAIFVSRIKKDAQTQCRTSCEMLGEYLSELEMQTTVSGSMAPFITYYKQNLNDIYANNREEIEEMSLKEINSPDDLAEKKSFFTELTSGLFGSGMMGLSYDKSSFRNLYPEVLAEMERLASAEGFINCKVFYYDAEHNNMVFMCDSTYTTSVTYSYPGSIEKTDEKIKTDVILKGGVAVFSLDDYFMGYAPVVIENETVAYVSFKYSIDHLVNNEKEFIWMLVGIMLGASVVIVLVYLFLADRWLMKNVTKLSDAARKFTSHMNEGEIVPVDAEIRTNDEIKDLSDDFFALQNKVAAYSEDIAKKSAEEERILAELNIASKIQLQSLPDKPLSTDSARISSFIKPAKEVGGDLFDYFFTDEGKVFFTIADVSGKGVPAALFMMRGKEIIRSCAKAGMSAAKIAETANAELCKNNKEGLFITAFIGVYDEKAKRLTYVRAGHEQPFLLRDGVAEKIGEESNALLGVFDDAPFISETLEIRSGDKILLYTDGLNEGINEKNEEFGYDRIKETLENASGEILAAAYEAEKAFAGAAEQFDDITMVLFECVKSDTIALHSPTYDDIPVVTDRINAFVQGLDPHKISELDVILDEILNNYVSYAFDAVKKPQIDIEARLDRDVVQLSFVDNGALFDPLQQQTPAATNVLDRQGGLGITLVKSLSDSIHYRVFEGKNHLTITKTLKG